MTIAKWQAPGSITGDELWLRCVFCGDSQNHPGKCHWSVNLKSGKYHCFRCRASGKLTTAQLFTLIMRAGVDAVFDNPAGDFDQEREIPELEPGAALSRPSALNRFHLRQDHILWDAFEIRDAMDEAVCGVYLRSTRNKDSRICGGGGFGWVGEHLPTSTPQRPLRVVEGPYDVLHPRDICSFGMVTNGLQDLKGHYLVLCPDGDVWLDGQLFLEFARKVYRYIWSQRPGPYIVGLEFLPDGLDPDQVPIPDREFLPREFITRTRVTRTMKRQRILEDLIHEYSD